MQTRAYAAKLTKEYLIKSGITLVTEDGLVFKGDKQAIPSISTSGYWVFPVYELDENGEKIKKPIKRQFKGCSKITDTYVFAIRTLGLHRIMWAWFYGEVPEGYVVDHINNSHDKIEDYYLSNLQLLTPAENLAKERPTSTKELPCKLNRPRSYYEDKLERYLQQYEEAKKARDAQLAHKLRANMANTRAKLRYWDAHAEEHESLVERPNLLGQIRKLATKAKNRGEFREWHLLLDILKDDACYTNEQLAEIVQAAQEV